MLITRIMTVALIAGLATGLLVSAVQFVWSLPLIEVAERYESAALAGSPDAADQAHDVTWTPEDSLERLLWTMAFNALYATGVGLVFAGAFVLRHQASWWTGLGWGALGFVAFSVAPAIGLDPTLPGAAAADLPARQGWWLLTALLTACGLGLLVYSRRAWTIAGAVALIVSPHLIGIPSAVISDTIVPANLGRQFALSVLVTSAVFWLLIGGLTGLLASQLDLPVRSASPH